MGVDWFEHLHPVTQALLGTLFTWFLTALGAGLVFFFKQIRRRVLDGMLGFAAGVMIAASYWSLLAPAIEMAEEAGGPGLGAGHRRVSGRGPVHLADRPAAAAPARGHAA